MSNYNVNIFLEQNTENYDKYDVDDYMLIVQKACILL